MLEIVIFVLLTVVGVVSAMAILAQKELFKASIGLAFVFVVVSGLIFVMGQGVIALLQLFILVGGLSTYLIVAVAAERQTGFEHVDPRIFIPVFLVIAAVLFYAIVSNTQQGSGSNVSIGAEFAAAISTYYALIAGAVFLVFAVGIGSIMLIKRAVRLVV